MKQAGDLLTLNADQRRWASLPNPERYHLELEKLLNRVLPHGQEYDVYRVGKSTKSVFSPEERPAFVDYRIAVPGLTEERWERVKTEVEEFMGQLWLDHGEVYRATYLVPEHQTAIERPDHELAASTLQAGLSRDLDKPTYQRVQAERPDLQQGFIDAGLDQNQQHREEALAAEVDQKLGLTTGPVLDQGDREAVVTHLFGPDFEQDH